ncbi:kinase-like protein [Violaceomyces palustris]|uniref:Kinase-like protein n=1 Tax=Violaceomyces palustris TaxID=1673888 RepID=A0ACD0P0B1_9BASI|nr:kinase-like protein [Violaceomyces palustris]
MAPSLSGSSLASCSTTSSFAEQEPELSRSLGSITSFDLRTPSRPLQMAAAPDSAAMIKASFENYSMSQIKNDFAPHRDPFATSVSPLQSNMRQKETFARDSEPGQPLLGQADNSQHRSNLGQSLGLNLLNPEKPSGEALDSPQGSSSRMATRPGGNQRPKLSLPPLASSAFSRPNVPQTPGGSLFMGARDGAATGAPMSPFMPPTPLVQSHLERGEVHKDQSDFFSNRPSGDPPGFNPLQKRQSLPAVSSVSPSNRPVRAPLQRNGSIGMSPLSSEFAAVLSVRRQNREDDLINRRSPGLSQDRARSGGNEATVPSSVTGSPSTLLTPPYSPLALTKGVQDEPLTGQRRSSTNSSSTSASSNKKRAKDSLIGAGSEMSRSLSASRTKAGRTKPTPKIFNLQKATESSISGRTAPGSAPAGQTTFPESVSSTREPLQLASSAHLVPSKGKSSAPMEKSLSAPLPPQTVSARHLADHPLHPIFARNYSLGDELGSGGFGFVVSARSVVDDKPVAVKFIWKEKVPAHGWVRDPQLGVIPMEAFVLKVVDHPGVVKFIELFDDHQFFYLVMELHGSPWNAQPSKAETLVAQSPRPGPAAMERRSSCDLFECIEQHSRLNEEQARWVFAQVVEAVWHLDRMGICHRDIKDENCVVDADFNVKLIDFGSAVITDVRKPPPYFNRFFGTMTFASSEILQGKPYRAPQAEVWSLGVLLSILISGECPFTDPTAAIKGRISKPKGAWSPDALNLLLGCLEVDPDKRATIGQVRDHPWVRRAWRGRKQPQS